MPLDFAGFASCGDMPSPADLRASLPMDLGFTLITPPPKTALTCSEMGQLGEQQPGMSGYKP